MAGTVTIVILVLCVIFTFFYVVELAPTTSTDLDEFDMEVERILNGSHNQTTFHPSQQMVSKVLRLSPAGANLTNYTLQWVPLGSVLFGNTVYYLPFG